MAGWETFFGNVFGLGYPGTNTAEVDPKGSMVSGLVTSQAFPFSNGETIAQLTSKVYQPKRILLYEPFHHNADRLKGGFSKHSPSGRPVSLAG